MGKKVALFCLVLLLSLVAHNSVSADTGNTTLIRLHVLANSETLADQQIKLMVRDEVLSKLNSLLSGIATVDRAEQVVRANLGQLAEVANSFLKQKGIPYTASLQYGNFNFPDKHYGTFTLPAGRYNALNIVLGGGGGRNWWCVVFPPMCLTSSVCELPLEGKTDTLVLKSAVWELWKKIVTWYRHL